MKDSKPKAVDILGYQINCVPDADGAPYVPLKWLCEILGMDDKRQRSKVKDHEAFNWKMLPVKGADGRNRKMLCLPVKEAGFWFYTVDPNTVKPEIKERLVAYHEESPIAFHFTKQYGIAFDPRSPAEEIESRVRGYYDRIVQERAPRGMTTMNREYAALFRELDVFREFEKEAPLYRDKAQECMTIAMNRHEEWLTKEWLAHLEEHTSPEANLLEKQEKLDKLKGLEKDYKDLHFVKNDLLELCNRLSDKEPELRDQLYEFFCRVHERCEAILSQILSLKEDLGCRYYWQPRCEDLYNELKS